MVDRCWRDGHRFRIVMDPVTLDGGLWKSRFSPSTVLLLFPSLPRRLQYRALPLSYSLLVVPHTMIRLNHGSNCDARHEDVDLKADCEIAVDGREEMGSCREGNHIKAPPCTAAHRTSKGFAMGLLRFLRLCGVAMLAH